MALTIWFEKWKRRPGSALALQIRSRRAQRRTTSGAPETFIIRPPAQSDGRRCKLSATLRVGNAPMTGEDRGTRCEERTAQRWGRGSKRVRFGFVTFVSVSWGPTWRGEIGEFCLGDLLCASRKRG